MENIIVCGDSGNKRLTNTIINACQINGGAFVADGNTIYQTSLNPRFYILSVTAPHEISCNGIVVLGNTLCSDVILRDMTVIVDGENISALHILQKQLCQNVITCSLNKHSTISLSAMQGSHKLVSLQRSVKKIDGSMAEPCEFYAAVSHDTDIYPLLASCTVMLLCDTQCREQYCIC